MRPNNYEFLSKSTVNNPISYSKSPIKQSERNYQQKQNSYMERSVAQPAQKSNFHNSRRGSGQMKQLRHTFDFRTNSKLQAILQKAKETDTEGQSSKTEKWNDFSKTQFGDRSTSTGFDLANSAVYSRPEQNGQEFLFETRKQKKNENTLIHNRKVDIDSKYKLYIEGDKSKKEAKQENRVIDELQRLREDRRKRQEAQQTRDKIERDNKSRQQQQFKQKQLFKKKEVSNRFYIPTYEKTTYNYHQKFSLSTQASPTFEKITIDTKGYKADYSKQLKSPRTILTPPTTTITTTTSYVSSLKPKPELSLYNGEINGFILGKQLGQGKFGTVFQGFHKKTGSLYAIKKVPKEMIKSHLMVDQFCLEIKIQMFLNHENILTLFNYFEDRTSLYLVLEYMDEGTLFAHLKKNKRLPEAEVAIKIKQIASALKYLHENQIAHRDIKPENIVMTHGVCKLCDFGWATICDQRRKTYCGTFDYAPPEILEGAQYDFTVDLWCLGVLAYELLVGKAPFYHISRKQTMKKILNVENTMIEYPDYISKTAISFIDNLIKKDPKQRITSDQILEHPFLKYAKTKMDVRKN